MEKRTIHTDILVAGSGPSGFAAAYTAAKSGMNVVIVEQSGDIGGISTSGLMSHWTGDCNSPVYHEILKRSAEKNEGRHRGVITNTIDPEKLKTLYLEMLYEKGVKIMLYTFACDAICENGAVKGVTVVNKSGYTDIFAKVIIDATGDGDIAFKAGAEFFMGRESDGKMQPATIMFKVGAWIMTKPFSPAPSKPLFPPKKVSFKLWQKSFCPTPQGTFCFTKPPCPVLLPAT